MNHLKWFGVPFGKKALLSEILTIPEHDFLLKTFFQIPILEMKMEKNYAPVGPPWFCSEEEVKINSVGIIIGILLPHPSGNGWVEGSKARF